MEVHFLDEQPHGSWCPTCRAPTLTVREWVAVDEHTLLITERGHAAACADCDAVVLVDK